MMILDLDYIDFPTGWAIQKAYPDLDHDRNCSANPDHPSGMGGRALLCDCPALPAKWRELRAERGERLTGDCEDDCQDACAYPGQFSECEIGAEE